MDSNTPTYKELLELYLQSKETQKEKRPSHRPVVPFLVNDDDKEKIVCAIKSTIEKLYNPLSEKFRLGKIHFAKTRFWVLAYLALAVNGTIHADNNVSSYLKLIAENFDDEHLVDGKHVSDQIHDIIDSETEFDFYKNIKTEADLVRLSQPVPVSKTLFKRMSGWIIVRAIITEEISKK